MNKVNTTHFWGQEGLAREYNAKIWADRGSEWDTTSLQSRFRDDRTAYTNGALSGLHWRLDASSDQLGISRIETIAIPPGETGFLAGTQLVQRGHMPGYGFDKLLKAQVTLAAQILAKAKTFQRPSLPSSGTFDPKPAEVPFQPGSQETWVVVDLPEEETIVALQKLCDVPVENFTAFLSPKSKGDRAHTAFKPTRELTLSELVEYLDITKQNYKEQLRLAELKRIEDARIAQEKREAEQKRLEEERKQKANEEHNKKFGRNHKRVKPPWLLAGGILLAVIGLASAFIAFNPFGPSGPGAGHGEGGQAGQGVVDSLQAGNAEVDEKTLKFQERKLDGCTEPRALNFDPTATQNDGTCKMMLPVILEGDENRTAMDSIFWQEHRSANHPKQLTFRAPSASAEDLNNAARAVLSTSDYDHWHVTFVATDPTNIDMLVWFSEKPGADRLSLQFDDAQQLPFKRIQVDIDYEDRDLDNDGYPASKDDFPFAAGKLDGQDYDGDDTDDVFDLDDDGDGIPDEIDDCQGVKDVCGICNGPGAIHDCGCKPKPRGHCDCNGRRPEPNLDCDGNCLNDTDGDGVCDENEIPGCQNPIACNYDPEATDPANEPCQLPEPYKNCDGDCLNDANGDGTCDEEETTTSTDSISVVISTDTLSFETSGDSITTPRDTTSAPTGGE